MGTDSLPFVKQDEMKSFGESGASEGHAAGVAAAGRIARELS